MEPTLVLAAAARVLTLAVALQTARAHQPLLRQAQASTEAAQAAADGARAPLLPQLAATVVEGRYRAGVGNIIELGDAQVALTSASTQVVVAPFRLATARAQLLFALGRQGA